LLPLLLGCACTFSAFSADAQTVVAMDPAGSLLRSLQGGSQPRGEAPLTPPSVVLPEVPLPQKAGASVMVTHFHIVASKFPEEILQEQLQDFIGKSLTLGDLEEAARRITKYYRDHDLFARAYLPRQTIKEGVVEIIVLEGRLGKITVDPGNQSRLDPEIAAGIVANRVTTGENLHPSDLENGLAVLNEIPGVAAQATLRAGTEPGQTDALLSVADTPLIIGNVTADNQGASWTGRRRAFGTMAVNDALGFGEQATVTSMKTANSAYERISVAAPVTYSGLTLGMNASRLDFAIAKASTAASSNGNAWTAGGTAAYPLVRSLTLSSTLTLAYDRKSVVNSILGQDSSNKNIDVANVGLVNSLADDLFGGGINQFGIGAAVGRLDLSANPSNKGQDALGPRTGGSYGKGMINASRTQAISETVEAYVALNGQLAAKNLDSSEQFALGGPTGIRAYSVNEGLGADGALGTAELRYRLLENVRLSGFYDVGWIQQYNKIQYNNYSSLQLRSGEPNAYVLEGAGSGITWTPLTYLEIKATAAHSIGPNPGRDANGNGSDGKHGRTQVWLSAAATF
jgi:hemolysin activation/secretion protein